MKNDWGGDWTQKKLDAFEKYVKAYLTIMHNTRKKYEGWPQNIIYFDGFAGSGIKDETDDTEQNPILKNLLITTQEQKVYKGSCERVLSLQKKFDKHILVDIDKEALKQLQNHLNNQNISLQNCEFIDKDVNEAITNFLNSMTKQDAVLMLLDPFGMQIEWQTIQKMKGKRIDLWILLPSGVVINRLLDKAGELKNIKLLESHLGLSEDEIKKKFYQKKQQHTLFGINEEVKKLPDAISKIAGIYVEKLQNIFNHVTKKPLELKNSKNVIIYHFIFASNNPSAQKIAGQIIDKQSSK